MTIPPHPFAPARASTRRRLSQESVVAAALEILDADGLEAVTMRAVAQKLGTGPASLYAHVRDRDELLELLSDQVIADVVVPAADPERWQEQIKEVLRSLLATFVRHKGIASASFGAIPSGPNVLRVSEGMLVIMRSGGVPKWACGLAIDVLSVYPVTVAHEEMIWSERASTATGPGGELDVVVRVHDYFAGLPVERFPLLRDMADELTVPDGTTRFEFGLQLLVGGLARLAEPADGG